MGVVQGIEEVVLYEENFNDNQAQDWMLEPGWTVTDGMLSGSGHKWVTYDAGYEWSDYRVNFQLRLLEEGSTIHLNYRLSENGRYYIGFHEGGLYLYKSGDTFLTESSISKGYNEWYNVEIIGEGSRIQVVVDGKLELDYTDPEPLLSGTIAFETLEGAVAQVDDIIVYGPSPAPKGPILSTNYGYVVLYEGNFNDNQAQDWMLEPGWTVTEGMLSGSGHNWAEYNAGYEWSDYRVKFQLLLEEGSNMHLNYRLSEKGRYCISFPEEGLYLQKDAPWETSHGILAESSISYGFNEWHNVEIIGEGPRIQIVVDDKLELDYTDPEPLLSGTIAFETLEGAVAQVDDIIVYGPSPTQNVMPTATWAEPEPLPEKEDDWPVYIFFIIAIGFIIFVLIRKRKTPLQEYKAKMEKWEQEGYDVSELKREMELKK